MNHDWTMDTCDLVVGGITYPSQKYDFVSWDDEIPIYGKLKNVPNHQPGCVSLTKKLLRYQSLQ